MVGLYIQHTHAHILPFWQVFSFELRKYPPLHCAHFWLLLLEHVISPAQFAILAHAVHAHIQRSATSAHALLIINYYSSDTSQRRIQQ